MIKVPEEGMPAGGLSSSKANKAKAKSLNAPAVSKVQEMRGMRLTKMEDLYCIECKNPMELAGHFKYVEMLLCFFILSFLFNNLASDDLVQCNLKWYLLHI